MQWPANNAIMTSMVYQSMPNTCPAQHVWVCNKNVFQTYLNHVLTNMSNQMRTAVANKHEKKKVKLFVTN